MHFRDRRAVSIGQFADRDMIVPELFEIGLRDPVATFQRADERDNTPDDWRSALVGKSRRWACCNAIHASRSRTCPLPRPSPLQCNATNHQIGQSAAVAASAQGGARGRDDPSAHPKARETLAQKDRAARPQGRSRLQNRWGRAWPQKARHECARNAFRRSARGLLWPLGSRASMAASGQQPDRVGSRDRTESSADLSA